MVLPLSAGRIRLWGLDLSDHRAWHSRGVATGGEGFGKFGLGDSDQDVGVVEFMRMGGGEITRVSLAEVGME